MDNKRKLSRRKASFLKIFQDDLVNKLPIPPAFTKIFEGEIPAWFFLEIVGTRKCWRVDIEEDDNGRLYLGYGFNCFVKAHSLETGNFLLFEHEKPSIVGVKIYEKDGSERTADITFASVIEVGAPSKSPTGTPIIHQERNAVQPRANKKQRGVIANGENERKKCFVSGSEHGVCFSLIWRKANHFLYYLAIPRAISGTSFSNKDKVTVTDEEGNGWKMELKTRPNGRVEFAQGWKEFVDDNDLGNGDKLTFEFMSNNLIQVHVQRASQVNDPSRKEQEGINQPSEQINLTSEDEELADVCTPSDKRPLNMGENVASVSKSSFSFNWTNRSSNSHLHIPKAIANEKKLENNDIMTLCDPKGKQWLMEVKSTESDGRVRLSRGWNDFTKAYGFGDGDTLNFEFVTDRMMKVNVVKACVLAYPIPGLRATVKPEVLKLD